MSRARAVRLVRSSAEPARWEVATRDIPGNLRAFVRNYSGYVERTGTTLLRSELPELQVPVIFEFGPPIRIHDAVSASQCTHRRGFVAGLDDHATLTEHDGYQSGIQLNLTPLGARAFFGFPMLELARKVVDLPDVLPKQHASIAARLAELPGWEARFDLLEALVVERLERSTTDLRAVAWALERIQRARGVVDVRQLTVELGYSHKHVIALFKDRVGFAPKLVARLCRFEHVMRHLRQEPGGSLAELAARFGYADQAHLSRDIRQFAGVSARGAQDLGLDWWPGPG